MRTADSHDQPDMEPGAEHSDTQPSEDELSDQVASPDGTPLSEDPVITSDPDLPNDQAPTVTSEADQTRASAQSNDDPTADQAQGVRELNWMGYVAFAAGAFALSIVAIVVGHLGLAAGKRGRANNRDFALAGTILGYIGLVATAVGLWLAAGAQATPAHVDVHAQQDVSAVGAAAATAAVDTNAMPEVSQTDTGYVVAGQAIDTHLEGERELTFTGDAPGNWCLDLTYEGGEQTAFSYHAKTGMAQGRCAP